jgi:hypothetical protein
MKEETYGIVWGTVLLVIGIIILLIGLSNITGILQNPSEKIEEWVPTEYRSPTAAFSWRSQGTSIGFIDTSIKGDAEIISWQWNFGEGSTDNNKNPTHTYSENGDYTVFLQVEDENGKTSNVQAIVTINEESNQGQTQVSSSLDLGLGSTFKRFAVITLFVSLFAILVMIGGRFLIAGCRLLRPMPKTFKVNIKPNNMEFEVPGKPKKVIEEEKKKSWFGKK